MKSDSDEPPSRHAAGVDTNEFFLPGAGVSALLIHGLTGTPYEMRYLGEQLAARGVRVRGVKLAGHAGTPEALGAVVTCPQCATTFTAGAPGPVMIPDEEEIPFATEVTAEPERPPAPRARASS